MKDMNILNDVLMDVFVKQFQFHPCLNSLVDVD